MLALFGADDFEALESRLIEGEGPSARRLRHLAGTLPVGEPSRLERMGFVLDRRPTSVNLRCARVSAPRGATWLLVSVPALGAASLAPPTPADGRDAAKPNEPPLPDSRPSAAAEFPLLVDPRPGGAIRRNAPGACRCPGRQRAAPRRDGGDASPPNGTRAWRRTRPRHRRAAHLLRHRGWLALGRESAAADCAFGRAPVRPPSRISWLSRLWGAWRRSRRAAPARRGLGDGACRGSLTPRGDDARTEPDAWRGAFGRRISRGVRGCTPPPSGPSRPSPKRRRRGAIEPP